MTSVTESDGLDNYFKVCRFEKATGGTNLGRANFQEIPSAQTVRL